MLCVGDQSFGSSNIGNQIFGLILFSSRRLRCREYRGSENGKIRDFWARGSGRSEIWEVGDLGNRRCVNSEIGGLEFRGSGGIEIWEVQDWKVQRSEIWDIGGVWGFGGDMLWTCGWFAVVLLISRCVR